MKVRITKDQFYRCGGFSNPYLFRTSHNVYNSYDNVVDSTWVYWRILD